MQLSKAGLNTPKPLRELIYTAEYSTAASAGVVVCARVLSHANHSVRRVRAICELCSSIRRSNVPIQAGKKVHGRQSYGSDAVNDGCQWQHDYRQEQQLQDGDVIGLGHRVIAE